MVQITVVSFDVGGVLGSCATSLGDALAQASQMPPEHVSEIVATRLHRCPEITQPVITAVADDLDLDPSMVRATLDAVRPLRMHPQAPALLAGLRRRFDELRIVVCSNVSAADANQISTVRDQLTGVVDEFVFSCERGAAKPTPELFELIEDATGACGEQIVHVGDKMPLDVDPALRAGWRALLVHPGPTQPRPARSRRYRTAADLPGAVTELHHWITESRTAVRPALPVRAAVRLRDDRGRIMVVRGPDDTMCSLPGGRLETYGADAPEVGAVREVTEEIGLTMELDGVLWWGWSRGESSRGENKMVVIFDGVLDGSPVPQPDPTEVAEARWVTRAEAATLLHPREADRLDRIDRGEVYGWQED